MNGPYGTFFVIFSNSVLGFRHNTKKLPWQTTTTDKNCSWIYS